MAPSPWATNETYADLWIEQSINAGTYIGAVGYGMHIIVFFLAVYHLLTRQRLRQSWWLLLFVIVLFGMGSVNIACNIRFNEFTWIDYRTYPGGPFAYIMEQEANPQNVAADAAAIVATFMADGLLLYRCIVLWNRKWYLFVLPLLIYLASIVMSVFFVYQAAQPDGSLWAQSTIDFSIPYWALSMSLNIMLMLMLVSRIIYMRRQVTATLGHEHGQPYTNIAAILVESAVPYGVISFIFIVLYAKQNTSENLFLPLLVQIQCLAPELIVLRVARGRAWTSATFTSANATGVRFKTRTTDMPSGISAEMIEEFSTDLSTITYRQGSDPELAKKRSTVSFSHAYP